MTNYYISMAVLKAKEGKQEKLKDELLKLVNPSRQEAGCLEYVLFEDKQQAGTFYMREAFTDQLAFIAHCNTSHFKNFEAQIDELMDGPITLIELMPVVK